MFFRDFSRKFIYILKEFKFPLLLLLWCHLITGNFKILMIGVVTILLSKIIKNPFRGPSNNRVLRLDLGNNLIEVISNYDITKYLIRYIRKPNPIILVDLEDELSINGVTEESECELDSSLHRTILDRAVALALQTMYSK